MARHRMCSSFISDSDRICGRLHDLTRACMSDSLALEYWSGTWPTPDQVPARALEYFQLCFTLLQLSCCKTRIVSVKFGDIPPR